MPSNLKENDSSVSAEKKMWQAVILRAFQDACKSVYTTDEKIAFAWFYENKKNFRFVCSMADFCPDFLNKNFINYANKNFPEKITDYENFMLRSENKRKKKGSKAWLI